MLALIAEGYTNRAIGEVLHLSEKTVRNHVSQLLRKLGFQRRQHKCAPYARLFHEGADSLI